MMFVDIAIKSGTPSFYWECSSYTLGPVWITKQGNNSLAQLTSDLYHWKLWAVSKIISLKFQSLFIFEIFFENYKFNFFFISINEIINIQQKKKS